MLKCRVCDNGLGLFACSALTRNITATKTEHGNKMGAMKILTTPTWSRRDENTQLQVVQVVLSNTTDFNGTMQTGPAEHKTRLRQCRTILLK